MRLYRWLIRLRRFVARVAWTPDEIRVGRLWTVGIVFGLLYTLTNRFQVFPVSQLPMGPIDLAVPLVPWTLLVYVSEIPLIILAYLWLKDPVARSLFAARFVFVMSVSIPIFIFFPIEFPRELYPVDPNDGFWAWALYQFRTYADGPANCLPSLHVALCFTMAYAVWLESKKMGMISILWSLSIAVATLTTKQHYFVDVVAGWILASAAALLFRRSLYD